MTYPRPANERKFPRVPVNNRKAAASGSFIGEAALTVANLRSRAEQAQSSPCSTGALESKVVDKWKPRGAPLADAVAIQEVGEEVPVLLDQERRANRGKLSFQFDLKLFHASLVIVPRGKDLLLQKPGSLLQVIANITHFRPRAAARV
jgi:hypothetical protein